MDSAVKFGGCWVLGLMAGRFVAELVVDETQTFGDYFGRRKLRELNPASFFGHLFRCVKCVGWWARLPVIIWAAPKPKMLTVPVVALTAYEADRQWVQHEINTGNRTQQGRMI